MTTGRVALPSGASQPAARKAGMMPPVMSEEGTSAVTFDMRMQEEPLTVIVCDGVMPEESTCAGPARSPFCNGLKPPSKNVFEVTPPVIPYTESIVCGIV